MLDDMGKQLLKSAGKEGVRGLSYGGIIFWVLTQVWNINNERMMNTAKVEVQAVRIQNLEEDIKEMKQARSGGKRLVNFKKIEVPKVHDHYMQIHSKQAGMLQQAFGK